MVLVGLGVISYVQKLPKWSGDITLGLPTEMIPSLLLLGIGLALLTGIAIAVMKKMVRSLVST